MTSEHYPNLTTMIHEMSYDNYGTMTPEFEKPEDEWTWPENAEELETLAATLDEEEKETMVAGAEEETQELVKAKGLESLDIFLLEVFDGNYHYNFYREV